MLKRWIIVIFICHVVSSCSSDRSPTNVFDVDYGVDADKLLALGYEFSEDGSFLTGSAGEFRVEYTVVEELGVFAISIVSANVPNDSSRMADWLENQGAIVFSPLYPMPNGGHRFFIKGISSGQVFTVFKKGKVLVANLDFPNTGDFNRSKYRSVSASGEIVIKHGDEVISRNDWEGF